MEYKSKRVILKELIEKYVIPGINKKDLDYYELVKGLVAEAGASKDIVEDVLKSYISNGAVKEIRILTISDGQIGNWLSDLVKEESEIKKDLEVLECQKTKEQDTQ